MKLLLGSVLGIEPSHYTNTEKAPININKIQAKTWGDIFIIRYDPTKEDSKKYEIGVTNIDNDDNSSGNSDDDDDDDDSNNNDSDDNDDSNNDSDDDDINDGGVAARENNNDNVLGANNSDARSSENAANTNIMALKDIFHKVLLLLFHVVSTLINIFSRTEAFGLVMMVHLNKLLPKVSHHLLNYNVIKLIINPR